MDAPHVAQLRGNDIHVLADPRLVPFRARDRQWGGVGDGALCPRPPSRARMGAVPGRGWSGVGRIPAFDGSPELAREPLHCPALLQLPVRLLPCCADDAPRGRPVGRELPARVSRGGREGAGSRSPGRPCLCGQYGRSHLRGGSVFDRPHRLGRNAVDPASDGRPRGSFGLLDARCDVGPRARSGATRITWPPPRSRHLGGCRRARPDDSARARAPRRIRALRAHVHRLQLHRLGLRGRGHELVDGRLRTRQRRP